MSNTRWHALFLFSCLVYMSAAEEHVLQSGSKTKTLMKRYDSPSYSKNVSEPSPTNANNTLDLFDQRKRNMSLSCELMSNDPSYCVNYSNTECHSFMESRNVSTIPRACINGNMPTQRQIKDFFSSLKSPFKGDEDCTEIEKWIVCSVIYPECNVTSSHIKLPCKDICTLGEANACRSQTLRRFHHLQNIIFGQRFIPSCENLPSNDEAGECDFPQFIEDILHKHSKEKNEEDDINISVYIGVGIGVLLVFISIVIYITIRFRVRKKRYPHTRVMSLQDIHTIHRNITSPNRTEELFGDSCDAYQSLESLITDRCITCFKRDDLVFQEYLGEGEFGKVVRCSTPSVDDATEMILVAVKYLKPDASDALETNFLEEVKILSQFKHPHVIPLLGVSVDKNGPKCIVLEFMKYGDLNQYIRERSGSYYASAGCDGYLPEEIEYRSPEISYRRLLFIAHQIADGVSYLASKRFVHRDLATRNILVGNDMHVKIADFGMARDIYGSDYYRVDSRRLLPLRWLSPEALTLGKFTIYSDIWAFGILLWELFTYGMQPFGGYSNEEICDQIRRHKLLEKPYGCPKQIYDLMKSCWKFDPICRKSCSSVKETISLWLEVEEQFIEIAWKHLLFRPMTTMKGKLRKERRYLSEGEITL